ncbi:ribosome biogenesis GTPase Der [Patescibacteria group bacterium]|nr:ribosome biogenesis GTPase Der [Patescibacteria group bacterium]
MTNNRRTPIVAIVGRANVGKSSLFNALLRRREAIVTREAGTTRDSISAKAEFHGRQFWLVDTAGFKDPEDEFEQSIQDQIRQASLSADIILVVVEADIPASSEDRTVAELALKSGKPIILVVNKIDKAHPDTAYEFARLGINTIQPTSVTQHLGINELLEIIINNISHVPVQNEPERLKVALLGRPNVGKSSLFNALLNKQQALVAQRAGTTRDVNRAVVRFHGQEIELLDTAGIRRNGKIERGVEHFSVLRALAAIVEADICLLLIDANEPSAAQDQKIAGMVSDAGRGLALLISKWDVLAGRENFDYDRFLKQVSADYEFVSWAPLIVTSSISGQNVSKLFELISKINEARKIVIPTHELNDWLIRTVREHPPAGLKNRLPKLKYMVQESDNPIPSFKIFGTHTRFIHFSYRRYLENKLRETFDFFGNPIQLWFIDNNDPKFKEKD